MSTLSNLFNMYEQARALKQPPSDYESLFLAMHALLLTVTQKGGPFELNNHLLTMMQTRPDVMASKEVILIDLVAVLYPLCANMLFKQSLLITRR
jgi:hypothetical protein